MTEKYIFQSFKEPVTYSKHLRPSFLAFLMTSISPQAGGDMEELCPPDISIHGIYISVKSQLNVTAAHQPRWHNKGEPLSPRRSRKDRQVLSKLQSSKHGVINTLSQIMLCVPSAPGVTGYAEFTLC